jgi:hypothetical protein
VRPRRYAQLVWMRVMAVFFVYKDVAHLRFPFVGEVIPFTELQCRSD